MTQKTPPLLKWLLVERATLTGDIERSDKREATLKKELVRAQERHARLSQEIELLKNQTAQLIPTLASQKKRLAALDSTIAAAYDNQVAPGAGGMVRAFAVEYGTRGSLKGLLTSMLQNAAPASLDTLTILQGVIDHFGLNFATTAERRAYIAGTLKRQLLTFKAEGLVESLHAGKGARIGVWRWKDSTPTLANLMAQMAAQQDSSDALAHSL